MMHKVLLVDDDENVLAAFHRIMRNRYQLDVAMGAAQALQAMEGHGPYEVMVADMQMPGMNGLELLQQVQERYPGTIRIMLTGNLDQRTATEAINLGHVFRFLTKPCSMEEMCMAVDAGIRQYRLEAAERELLEQTLTGAIKVLTEILALSDPHAFGRAEVLRERALEMASHLGITDTWEIGLAAMMSPLGLVTIPPALVAKERAGGGLTPKELETVQRVPEFGAKLLERIPRLEGVARAVLYQRKNFSGGGFPMDDLQGEAIPLAARIIRVLSDFLDIEDRRGATAVSLEHLRLRAGCYDPAVLRCLEELCGQEGPGYPRGGLMDVAVSELQPGMVLMADVKTKMGMMVACEGTRILASHVEKLQNFARLIGIGEPIRIRDDRKP